MPILGLFRPIFLGFYLIKKDSFPFFMSLFVRKKGVKRLVFGGFHLKRGMLVGDHHDFCGWTGCPACSSGRIAYDCDYPLSCSL